MTAAVGQYALYVVAVAALIVWLTAIRREKINLAIEAIFVMVLATVMIKVAGAAHSDPRPFVQNPALKPLFAHSADNGFPSDHTALAAAIAGLVTPYRRLIGYLLGLLTIALGVSRVAANIHHLQDVAAGLIIGYLAAILGVVLWRQLVRPRLTGRLHDLTG
jgi:undecaprenyl-diphosphatase